MSKPIIPPAKTVLYATPGYLLRWIEEKFGPITYDPCPLNDAKIWDSLMEQWAGVVYVNPPYGAKAIPAWMSKRFEPERSIWLVPARTDTRWWHDWVLAGAKEIHWLQNRVTFGGMKRPASFPCVVIVFEKENRVPVHHSVNVLELQRTYA